jgi:hypothetical protein
MIVFVSSGEAWTWKTAYNENWARYSPGKLLVDRLPNGISTISTSVARIPALSLIIRS